MQEIAIEFKLKIFLNASTCSIIMAIIYNILQFQIGVF